MKYGACCVNALYPVSEFPSVSILLSVFLFLFFFKSQTGVGL